MAKICLCLGEETLDANLRTLEKYRRYIDLAELRVDKLLPDERFLIRRFPALAGMPVILTVRRKRDGGVFEGEESARLVLIANAISYAEADRRMNFAYIDIEEDIEVPSIEEAARAFGTRIIRSIHAESTPEDPSAIIAKAKSLLHFGDEIIKLAAPAHNLNDVAAMFNAASELRGIDKLLISMGSAGMCTRILACKFGSLWTFASAKDAPVSPGQLDPETLCKLYRFRDININTDVYGILGFPLKVTASPPFFNPIFSREKMNAVYLPFPSEDAAAFFRLADALNIKGVSVTVPHKQSVMPYLAGMSANVKNLGACNTMIRTEAGWDGHNTDILGFSDSILNFMKRKSFRGIKATVIGAGGAARAVVYQIWRGGGKAFVVNRSRSRAEELADRYGFMAGGLDENSTRTIKKFSRLIINTTSVGMGIGCKDDPLFMYKFQGTEVVMDLIYVPEQTALLARAAAAGCPVLNGYDMLIRQAKYQYKYFFGAEYPQP
ncbi:MAG: type I 3-dehydroquinate dehydratase [Spirochaetaceae bacterium]|jgi:3-dehydroquinate dehydratase/shikimate dehydrogenase|nr:type I 3-dehydroquinate dehydratase [Spirochaetaceae bacterium]